MHTVLFRKCNDLKHSQLTIVVNSLFTIPYRQPCSLHFYWNKMDSIFGEILFDKDTIAKRVAELGQQISKDYENETEELVIVCILKGAVIFFSDLTRSMSINFRMDFMQVSSYGNEMKSSGEVRIVKDLSTEIAGKNVLVVEDIIDTGKTLLSLVNLLKTRNPKSVKVVAMLDKVSRRVEQIDADYKGFVIEDKFVVGYGLDWNQFYRHVPYIGVVKAELYQ